MCQVFAAWAVTASREAGVRSRMRAMAIRMARRTEVLILQEWHRYTVEAHSYMKTALARWLNEQLSNAFDQWAKVYADLVFSQVGAAHLP